MVLVRHEESSHPLQELLEIRDLAQVLGTVTHQEVEGLWVFGFSIGYENHYQQNVNARAQQDRKKDQGHQDQRKMVGLLSDLAVVNVRDVEKSTQVCHEHYDVRDAESKALLGLNHVQSRLIALGKLSRH